MFNILKEPLRSYRVWLVSTSFVFCHHTLLTVLQAQWPSRCSLNCTSCSSFFLEILSLAHPSFYTYMSNFLCFFFFSGLGINITLRGNSLPDISKGRAPGILLLHLVYFHKISQPFSLLDCRLHEFRSCLSPRHWSNFSSFLRVWHKWDGQEILSDDWMICNHEL